MAKKKDILANWGVIAVAILLVWPVGVALVVRKFLGLEKKYAGKPMLPEGVVPFKDKKTTAQIKIYRTNLKGQKSKRNTNLATMVIGLLVACGGITYFYISVFSGGYQESLLTSLGACALFGMAGIMQGTKGFAMLEEKKQLAMMAELIDDRQVVTEAELQEKSGLSREEVRSCLQTMFDRCYFADGVHADEENGTFICHK